MATGKVDPFVYLCTLQMHNSSIAQRFAFIQHTEIVSSFSKVLLTVGNVETHKEVAMRRQGAHRPLSDCKDLFCVCSESRTYLYSSIY